MVRPRGSRTVLTASVVVSLLTVCAVRPARAQALDPAAAQSLFEEAKRLMSEKSYAAACPKLAESQRLDPAAGTVIALALCHEGEGRTATAWAEFNTALSDARRDRRPDREGAATEHIKALEPRLVRVRLVVSKPVDGLEVKRNGVAIGSAQWAMPVAVDPGAYVFEATAPKKQRWTANVSLTEEGKTVDVVVPALADDLVAAAPPAPVKAGPPPTEPTEKTSDGGAQRTLGLVLGGAGLLGAAVGAGFGLRASSKWDDAEKACPANRCPSAAAAEMGKDAGSAADVSTVLFVVSGLAVAGGAVLFFTAPSGARGTDKASRVRVAPWASGTGGGAMIGGTL